MAKADLTAQRLREVLNYNHETGDFTYRSDRRNGSKAGDVAGWIEKPNGNHKCRRSIEIDQHNYRAHRLAWLYVYGAWPNGVIDHINGDALDNRITNLRDVSQRANVQNQRAASRHTKSGLLGVHWDKGRRLWLANIRVDGRTRFLGRYGTPEEAHAAYLAAKRKLHEGCTI
jgi:hypothetical protein